MNRGKKKLPSPFKANQQTYIQAKRQTLPFFSGFKLMPLSKRIIVKSIKPILATNFLWETCGERRVRMRTIFRNCIIESVKASRIPERDKEILIKLSKLFSQHINEKNQPENILERFTLTPMEKQLAKSLSPESIKEIRKTLYAVFGNMKFKTEERYISKEYAPNWTPKQHKRADLKYFLTNLEFFVKHDIFHAVTNFERFMKEAGVLGKNG